MNLKSKTARLSVLSNLFLVGLKLFAGFLSGSVSILSEAIHSMMDLIASIIAFVSVRVSAHPPDARHPYGHGKFENVSGVLEAILIFIAAGWIIFEAIQRFYHPSPVQYLGLSSLVMAISAGVNFFVSKKLYQVAKQTDSIALEADALHLKTDVYTSIGVAVGLLLMFLTELPFFDPLAAILVALLILKESYSLFMQALLPLLDNSLPEVEISQITDAISKHSSAFHDLRTRKSGSSRFIDFHLEVPGQLTVAEAHSFCDQIEKEIQSIFHEAEVNIHIENI